MQRLSEHIKYLLRRGYNVNVPDIGVFEVEFSSAFYDENEGLFFPCSKKFTFNAICAKGNYTLLLKSYLRKYQVSQSEALSMLKADITDILKVLRERNEVYLLGLGILSLEGTSMLNFEFSSKFKAESEMSSLPVLKIVKNNTHGLSNPKQGHLGETIIKGNSKYYYLPINKTCARIAASLLLVATVGLVALMPLKVSHKANTAAIVPVEATTVYKGKQATEIDHQFDSNIKDSKFEEEAIKSPGKFCLIVASFKTEKEAQTFIEDKKSLGYEMKIEPGKNIIRISLADSDSSRELYAMLNQKEIKKSFPDAWVWER